MILIVGAGLAGLSAAYHLRGMPYKILEREREVGGLCRSYVKDGFTFDYTGHLLHFRQTAIKALVESLLPDQLHRVSVSGEYAWSPAGGGAGMSLGVHRHAAESVVQASVGKPVVQTMDRREPGRGYCETFHGAV